ncbi:restriction endonuclease subunit S [Nocardiopsis sp. NPDC007018]|uniref:restriction endonuclease subunit S n=1 Tax=Nocardiopsis sp. NPDC007018 TaxID=3155721 RepID=UPI0033E8140F
MSGIEVLQLGDVAEFIRGVTFKPEDVIESSEDTVWCMRTKNVQKTLDTSSIWSIDRKHIKRDDQYLREGDILVSSANSWNLIGKCSWVPRLSQPSTFGGFISNLRADRRNIDPRYLYHWFSSPKTQFTVRSLGRQTTNISNLDIKRCLKMPVPVPNLETQERITDLLDKLKDVRNKRRRSIDLLDELVQSAFLQTFGDPGAKDSPWPRKQFGEITTELRYGTSSKSTMSGFPTLRIPNVVSGTLDLTEIKTVPATDAEFDRLRLQDGDLLFVRSNGNPEYVGRCALFNKKSIESTEYDSKDFIYASYLIRARPDQSLTNPVYLREFMLSQHGRTTLRLKCKTSAGQYNINGKNLSSISVPIPPLALQNQFAERISQISFQRAQHQAHLAHLDELFASVQQRAFDGTLWDDRDITP